MNTGLLSVRNVHVNFGGMKVLQGINLDVAQGEIRGLIGPNGAGKTTMLNVISGILRPQQGDIQLAGTSIVGLKPSQIAELGLGRTFQTSQLFKGMTVLENLMTGLHRRTRGGFLTAGFFAGVFLATSAFLGAFFFSSAKSRSSFATLRFFSVSPLINSW